MFDTRSGFWLLASIGILALLATASVILFASDDQLTYPTFTSAINIPMTVILPIIAILSVTGEWSQRSGLTTFTLVPHRGRVIAAKAIASVGVAVVTIPLAFGIGALGNLVGTAIAGIDPVWDLTVLNLATNVLANVLSLLFGFMLGVVIRNSVGALVAYFVYQFLLPTLSLILAASHTLVPRPPALGRLRLRPKRPVQRGPHHPAVDPPRLHRDDLADHPHDHRPDAGDERRSQIVHPPRGIPNPAPTSDPHRYPYRFELELSLSLGRREVAATVPEIAPAQPSMADLLGHARIRTRRHVWAVGPPGVPTAMLGVPASGARPVVGRSVP